MPTDRTSLTDDERIGNVVPLPPPEHLIQFFPIRGTAAETLIAETRRRVQEILRGRSDRLLVVIGPCSIHDPAAALEYAARLAEVRRRLAGDLEVLMRVYFEKPRTTVGWKGLINDPHLNGSFRIHEGLRIARDLLVRINLLGVPAGSEFLDVISPQYIGDLISWGAIGARTTESQVHRELASGLSAPVGFKNGTDGNVRIACDAILAARQRHHFLSVHKNGQVAIVETRGNEDCHLILRGGRTPNYDAASVAAACEALAAAGLEERLMIDLSHANSAKDHRRQKDVAADGLRAAPGRRAADRGRDGRVEPEGRAPGHRRRDGRSSTGRASPTPASAGRSRCPSWRSSPRPCGAAARWPPGAGAPVEHADPPGPAAAADRPIGRASSDRASRRLRPRSCRAGSLPGDWSPTCGAPTTPPARASR